jgi:hypothetical protein
MPGDGFFGSMSQKEFFGGGKGIERMKCIAYANKKGAGHQSSPHDHEGMSRHGDLALVCLCLSEF